MNYQSNLLTKILLVAVCIATSTISISSGIAQTADEVWVLSQRDMSMGARMKGMSARGFAGFGDHSAMHSNPSGLGYVANSQVVVSVRGYATSSITRIITPEFSEGRNLSSAENSGLGNLTLLYDVPVARGKLVAGIGIGQVRDFSRKLDFSGGNNASSISGSFLPFDNEYSVDENGDLDLLNDLPFAAFNGGIIEYYKELYEKKEYPFHGAVVPGSLIQQSGLITESGEMYELNIGGAWQASRKIMAGASINIVFGDYRFDYLFSEIDINDENTSENYNVLQDDGTLLEGFHALEYQQRLATDIIGVNLRAGISTELNDWLHLGMSFESPTWTYVEESYAQQFHTWFDIGGKLSYGGLADDVGNGVFQYSMRSPMRLGGGLRFDPGRFVLTGEAELVNWRQLRIRSDEGRHVFSDVNDQISSEFGVALNLALGGELRIRDFNLRGGFALHPSPYTENIGSGRLQLGERYSFSLGAGIGITDGIRLDFGVQAETERDIWDAYPSDSQGARQNTLFKIDEELYRISALLEVTMKL